MVLLSLMCENDWRNCWLAKKDKKRIYIYDGLLENLFAFHIKKTEEAGVELLLCPIDHTHPRVFKYLVKIPLDIPLSRMTNNSVIESVMQICLSRSENMLGLCSSRWGREVVTAIVLLKCLYKSGLKLQSTWVQNHLHKKQLHFCWFVFFIPMQQKAFSIIVPPDIC